MLIPDYRFKSYPESAALALVASTCYNYIMNTKQIGEITEAVIVAELLKRGYSVSRPVGDNQRYDLLLDVDGSIYKVQCKTAKIENDGGIQFNTASTYGHRGGGRRTYLGEVDFILAYCPGMDKVYWEQVSDDTPKAARTLYFKTVSVKTVLASSRELDSLPVR